MGHQLQIFVVAFDGLGNEPCVDMHQALQLLEHLVVNFVEVQRAVDGRCHLVQGFQFSRAALGRLEKLGVFQREGQLFGDLFDQTLFIRRPGAVGGRVEGFQQGGFGRDFQRHGQCSAFGAAGRDGLPGLQGAHADWCQGALCR